MYLGSSAWVIIRHYRQKNIDANAKDQLEAAIEEKGADKTAGTESQSWNLLMATPR